MHLDRKILTTYFLLHSMHKKLPIITLFAQRTSQHYFVLQSLRKALPSTTSYYVACTKHFPILLCTAKLAQSTSQSQYYFVLQSLHKARPSTTLYYAACTKQWTTTRCRTQRRNRSRSVRPQLHLPHSRGTFFIAGRSHFTRKNTRFPGPAFSQNEAHATSMQPLQCITMRFATSGCAHHPASLDAHGNTKRHNHAAITLQSATRESTNAQNHAHMNKHSLQNTGEEPIALDPSRTRRTHEVSFIAGRSHFTRKNTRFPAPAFSQNEAHATSMQPLQCTTMRFATSGCAHHPVLRIVSQV